MTGEEMWHIELIEGVIEVCVAARTGEATKVRGEERQRQRRRIESEVRLRVVTVAQKLVGMGRSRHESAAAIGIGRSTLSRWETQWRNEVLEAKPRGRPAARADEATRRQVRDLIDRLGPTVGLRTLVDHFPHVAREELMDILNSYRLEFVSKNSVLVQVCRWRTPGRVWAMDFARPPKPIDGVFPSIFVVRDLGSRAFLLWLPVPEETGREVLKALELLFLLYDPPLVLKSDNGAQFKIKEIAMLLLEKGVIHLWSPKYYPQYNGSIESGIGTLKVHTHHEAARDDRVGQWSSDDLEAARLRSNHYGWPRGSRGPSANTLWDERTPITQEERIQFYLRVDVETGERIRLKREEKGVGTTEDEIAEATRQAITATLVAFGYLLIRRRRISPPYKSKIWSSISR
jgi:transposase InsO family protein